MRALAFLAIGGVLILALSFYAPISQGYHFGCNPLAGPQLTVTRLGVQMCKPSTGP